MGRRSKIVFVGALALGSIVGSAGAAAARPLDRGQISDDFVVVEEDFCGQEGLTVRVEGRVEGRFLVGQRGQDRLPYYLEQTRASLTWSALDDEGDVVPGATVTGVERVLNKDLKVVVAGDRELEVQVLATGAATYYDADGAPIARNLGQVRFSLLVDHGGTPTDPSDDEVLDFLGIDKESTGRTDDFCAAVLPELVG